MYRILEWTLLTRFFVLAGAGFALSCSGSESSGTPAGASGDASVGSGGQSGSTGGTSAGGATGSGGRNSASGGTQVNSGGAANSGGNASGAGGTSGASCGGRACRPPAEVCIAHRTVGGGVLLPDAGRCPAGTHIESIGTSRVYCAADYAYECVDLVGCNPGSISCSCGAAICPSRYPACSNPSTGRVDLDPIAQLVCELQAP